MSTLKSSYELALERFATPAKGSPSAHPNRMAGNPMVHCEMLDTEVASDNSAPDMPENFFVDHLPRDNVGSRAQPIEEKVRDLTSTPLRTAINSEAFFEGPLLTWSGFSKMNREIVSLMDQAGVPTKVIPVDNRQEIPDKEAEKFLRLKNTDVSPTAPKIQSMTVPATYGHSGRRILYTMMETSNGVHPEYMGKINLSDEVWVPSDYLADILVSSGLYADIKVMPLGVDVNRYCPEGPTLPIADEIGGFRFLSVFNWSIRKGWDILIRAYLQEFSPDDDVTLIISSRMAGIQNSRERITGQIANLKKRINQIPGQLPRMVLYDNVTQEDQMPALYRSAHAFALMSRGEGFGLPFLEAGACGLPVIGTACTAMLDFLNEDNSWAIQPDGFKSNDIADACESNLARMCRFYEGQEFPVYSNGAVEETMAAMREVYEDYNRAKRKGAQLRSDICENLTWNHAVNRIIDRLEDLKGEE